MRFLFLLPIIFVFFACAPLRPLGPPTTSEAEPEPLPVPMPQALTDTINVGVGFEKDLAVIECPEKKWEFKAGASAGFGRTEIETKGDCKYGGKVYRGRWAVLSTDSGLAVINVVLIEDYLKGLVPHEIGKLKRDEMEALKAQAVAARTYAYRHLGSRKSQGFDIYADVRDQVYNGKADEDSLANEAILATAGLVIKYNGDIIESYYHSTCGGKTESAEIWGQEGKPYLLPISDSANGRPFCELSRYMKWEETFSKAELIDLFQMNAADARADKIFSFNKIEQILVTEKFPGGRVKRLVVFTDKGSFEVFGDRTRRLFARNGKFLPGLLFGISQNGDNFTITGSGYGHGIGMCQMGTRARAKAGQNFEEILKAYYAGVTVEAY